MMPNDDHYQRRDPPHLAQLVNRAKTNDGEAWCELIGYYTSPMLAHARRFLRAYHDAEEVVENTWTSLFENGVSNFKDGASFHSYVMGALQFKLIDFLRAQGRLQEMIE